MTPLRDALGRCVELTPRAIGPWLAPALRAGAPPTDPRHLEEAALSLLAHLVRERGPIREAVVAERRRFERLVGLVYRLPAGGPR